MLLHNRLILFNCCIPQPSHTHIPYAGQTSTFFYGSSLIQSDPVLSLFSTLIQQRATHFSCQDRKGFTQNPVSARGDTTWD